MLIGLQTERMTVRKLDSSSDDHLRLPLCSPGPPGNKVVFFNVDSIGSGDSLPFPVLNDPKGAPVRILNLGLGLPLPFTRRSLGISSTLNPANSHPALDFLPFNE